MGMQFPVFPKTFFCNHATAMVLFTIRLWIADPPSHFSQNWASVIFLPLLSCGFWIAYVPSTFPKMGFCNFLPQIYFCNFLEPSISCRFLPDLRSTVKCRSYLNVADLHFSFADHLFPVQVLFVNPFPLSIHISSLNLVRPVFVEWIECTLWIVQSLSNELNGQHVSTSWFSILKVFIQDES